MDDDRERVRAIAMDLPAETRLALVAWVFYAIGKWRRDQGTYRYLLQECLELPDSVDAYGELMEAGALGVMNALELADARISATTDARRTREAEPPIDRANAVKAAIWPFLRAYEVQMNPENVDLLVAAVLTATPDYSLEEVAQHSEDLLRAEREQHESILKAMRGEADSETD